ncbi:MAG: phosphoglucosamine mutase [Bradymonadia bacterium]|jgi:phosphoglucosamine mutase
MKRYFGTDGVRGTVNEAPMTVEMALRLGRAVALTFSRESHRARILVGKDTRLSGYMFEAALVAGITSTGANVIALGPLPTPGIAFLTTSMRVDAGIVISASHNPFHDNGFKVFGRDGFKLPDDVEERLENQMDADVNASLAKGADIGRARRIEDAGGRYVTHLKTMLRPEFDLEGLKIVVDCANGAAYKVAPTLFRELGAEVIELGTSPNGININDACGSLHPETAAAAVLEHGADLGVTLDGDADRLILLDEKGQVVDGDAVLGLCALEMQRQGTLAKSTVVATVMSNMGLGKLLESNGITLERTAVGDRYVVERLRAGGFNFGGEQSGHLVFLDHATTGDGLVAALQVINTMLGRQKPLSELASGFERYPQVLVNTRVTSKPPLDSLSSVQAAMKSAREKLGSNGRVVVRYSGTEPKVRVMLEGTDDAQIRALADEITQAFGKDVGFA